MYHTEVHNREGNNFHINNSLFRKDALHGITIATPTHLATGLAFRSSDGGCGTLKFQLASTVEIVDYQSVKATYQSWPASRSSSVSAEIRETPSNLMYAERSRRQAELTGAPPRPNMN